MIPTDYIYTSSKRVVNKDQSGNFKPALFNTYISMVNRAMFTLGVSRFQKSQQITDNMTPFLKKRQLILPSNGKFIRPDDYINLASFRSLYRVSDGTYDKSGLQLTKPIFREKKIDVLDTNQITARLGSHINPPSIKSAVAEQLDGYWQVYPNDIGTVVLAYFRKPSEPIWTYTINKNGVEVNNPATTINLEWNWQLANDIIIVVSKLFSGSVKEPGLLNFLEQIGMDL